MGINIWPKQNVIEAEICWFNLLIRPCMVQFPFYPLLSSKFANYKTIIKLRTVLGGVNIHYTKTIYVVNDSSRSKCNKDSHPLEFCSWSVLVLFIHHQPFKITFTPGEWSCTIKRNMKKTSMKQVYPSGKSSIINITTWEGRHHRM